MSRILVSFLL